MLPWYIKDPEFDLQYFKTKQKQKGKGDTSKLTLFTPLLGRQVKTLSLKNREMLKLLRLVNISCSLGIFRFLEN